MYLMSTDHNTTNKGDASNKLNIVRVLYNYTKCVLSLEELNERMLIERVQFDAQLDEVILQTERNKYELK